MDDFDYVIIGSGPSSTGFYLSEKFQKVSSSSCIIDTALDYNNILDKEPSSDFLYKIHDVNHKTYYGDKGATQYKIPFEYDSGFDMKNSYYLGGLTNVWGAACERYNSNELKKMGLSIEEEYYEKIEKHMHINNMLLPKKSKMRKIYTKLQRESNEKAFVTPAKLAVKFSFHFSQFFDADLFLNRFLILFLWSIMLSSFWFSGSCKFESFFKSLSSN